MAWDSFLSHIASCAAAVRCGRFHFTLTLPDGDPRLVGTSPTFSQSQPSSRDDQASMASGPPSGPPSSEEQLPSSWRVLVADDEEVIRMTVAILLQKVDKGWEVHEVDSGEDALRAATEAQARAAPYDLIVLDQYFGQDRMKGTEASAAMRSAGVTALIVGLTGDSHPEHNARARAAGQDHVLGKPFTDCEKLRRVLQRLLRDRALTEDVAASVDNEEDQGRQEEKIDDD